tara:strand:- start:520 stop:729 length:210 start_codon:yes stop_codon:yes gene_type:complete
VGPRPAISSSGTCGTIGAAVHLVLYLIHLGFELRDGPLLLINYAVKSRQPRAKPAESLVHLAPGPLFEN